MLRSAIRRGGCISRLISSATRLTQTDLSPSADSHSFAVSPVAKISTFNGNSNASTKLGFASSFQIQQGRFSTELEADTDEDDNESLLQRTNERGIQRRDGDGQQERTPRLKRRSGSRAQRRERLSFIYERMAANEIPHDLGIYNSAIKACSRFRDLDKAREVFQTLLKNGIEPDIEVLNSYLFAHCIVDDGLPSALEVFDSIENIYGFAPNAMSYRSLIVACGKSKDKAKAEEFFNEVNEKFGRQLRSYNTILGALSDMTNTKNGAANLAEGKKILQQIYEDRFEPDHSTYIELTRLCSRAGLLDEATDFLNEANEKGKIALKMYDCVITCMSVAQLPENELTSGMLVLLENLFANDVVPTIKTMKLVVDVFEHTHNTAEIYNILEKLYQKKLSTRPEPILMAILYCLEILTKRGFMKPEDAMKHTSHVASRLEAASAYSLNSSAYRSWLTICSLASNYGKAQECWEVATRKSGTVDRDSVKIMLELHLKNDQLRSAVNLFSLMDDENLRPWLEHFKLVFEYMVEKDAQEPARSLFERMEKARVKPDDTLKEHLASLKLI